LLQVVYSVSEVPTVGAALLALILQMGKAPAEAPHVMVRGVGNAGPFAFDA